MDKPARAFGLLLHPTSLPGRHGTGDLGAGARAFVDFLRRAGASFWQILPLVPPGPGGSPYSSRSSLAMSTSLIDLDALVRAGLISQDDAAAPPVSPDAVDRDLVRAVKEPALFKAARRLASDRAHQALMNGDQDLRLSGRVAEQVRHEVVHHLLGGSVEGLETRVNKRAVHVALHL